MTDADDFSQFIKPRPEPEQNPPPVEDFLGDVDNWNDSAFRDVSIEDGPPPTSEIISDRSHRLNDDDRSPLDEGGVFDDATVTIGDGECAVCGAPVFRPPGLTKSGRKKRVPKYCELHNPNVRVTRKDEPQAPIGESQLRKVQEELADDIRLLGTLSGSFYPVTGYYLLDNADAFTTAVLKLCKNNPNMLRILHRAAQVAPVYTIAKTGAGVAYSMQVDQKKADPHSGAARRLGVEDAYNAVYSEQVPTSQTNGWNTPPKYSVVQ